MTKDLNPQQYKQMMNYLTRPKQKPREFEKTDNSPVMVSNGEIMTENQFVKSLPIEDQPGYDPDKDPNLLRRIKYYQGESLGADFDVAIAEEDKALKKLGRDPANILQRNRKVQPLVPKRATTKQMTELKGKIDKYKKVHFPKEEKPFTKIANNLGKNKPFKKESFKLDPLPQIDFSTIAPPKQRTPEEIAMEQRFNELLKKSEDEKVRNATTGLAGLVGGDPNFKFRS